MLLNYVFIETQIFEEYYYFAALIALLVDRGQNNKSLGLKFSL